MSSIDQTSQIYDPLTGLPSRVLLLDRLGQALARSQRPGSLLALLVIDLDDLNRINDSFGHLVGDQLLVAVGRRLAEVLRPGDTVARLGGDEFAILCEDIASEIGAARVAERALSALAEPIPAAGFEHRLTASVGIVVAEGGGALATDLLRDATIAMGRAQRDGGNRFELYDPSLRERLIARLTLEQELCEAVQRDQLRLYYQPVVSLADSRVIGAEALLRWQHPSRGLLLPAAFLDVAEDSGAILSLGKWVIDRALRDSSSWREAFPELVLSVSLNLSARQVAQAGIPRIVRETLSASGADPRSIELEITERALLDPSGEPERTLALLKELGVRVVLDDFGAGPASLAHLKRFPVDAVKIDPSFIAGVGERIEDTAIVAAIISLAGTLGIEVIAEGVETDEQAAALRTLGCHFAQGFNFSPPVPADVFSALLECAAGDVAVPTPRP